MKHNIVGAVFVSVPFIVGSAMAQVATPPPGPKPEPPAYVPPPPTPKPTVQPQTQPNQPRMGGNDPLDPNSLRGKLPPLKWRSLAQIDPKTGRIQQYSDPLDLAALKPNPSVAQSRVPEIMPVLAGRRYRMEQIVIDNLDFALQVDDGLLNTIDLVDPNAMKLLTDKITPLVPPKSITMELFDRGVLSRIQKDFNLEIMKDYQNLMMQELSKVYGDAGLTEFMKFIMDESVKEARIALDGMLMESTWRMDEVLAKAALSDVPGLDEIRAIRGSAADTTEDRAANIAKIKQIWKPWSFEQKQAFLRAVEETRQDPHVPPIPMLEATPEGSEDRTGSMQIEMNRVPTRKPPGGAGGNGG
ncbi:MAG: hypothetical protein DYG94_09200 [Leptolyngbya sp. PLA3]|nr:MAG: hypothetical protein EDM82_12135 [Cyanobacteria bacterium CYA]MCE7968908.1 hypothetical protein [Leptolyngbya sp. PL-A3]